MIGDTFSVRETVTGVIFISGMGTKLPLTYGCDLINGVRCLVKDLLDLGLDAKYPRLN